MNHLGTVRLITEKLILRQFNKADAEAMFKISTVIQRS